MERGIGTKNLAGGLFGQIQPFVPKPLPVVSKPSKLPIVVHIVSSAISTSPHFHQFLLNKAAKIGENMGSRDNHASNACKNQGVAQD